MSEGIARFFLLLQACLLLVDAVKEVLDVLVVRGELLQYDPQVLLRSFGAPFVDESLGKFKRHALGRRVGARLGFGRREEQIFFRFVDLCLKQCQQPVNLKINPMSPIQCYTVEQFFGQSSKEDL